MRDSCAGCLEVKLDQTMADSGFGTLIGRVGEKDYLLSKPGASISEDDIDADEFAVLRMIDDERAKYTKEQTDRIARENSQPVTRKARRLTD